MAPRAPDLTRITLGVLTIAGLLGGSLWILRPFIGSLLWAALIVVATWPAVPWLQARLGGRRTLAVALLALVLLLVLVVPLSLAVVTIVGHAADITERLKALASLRLGPLPEWVVALPGVGPWVAERWQEWAQEGPQGGVAQLAPYARSIAAWVVAQVGGLGQALLQFIVTVAIATLLYAHGEHLAHLARRCGRRLGGEPGEAAVVLCGQAIRGVALGVGGTALAQAAVAGLGLLVLGVPYAGLMTAAVLLMCLAQIGPLPVMLPAVAWLFWADHPWLASLLLVWTTVVGTMDIVLRPLLIRRGADLPLVLIFGGVVGGLLAFGVVGIFIGPVVLAVTYTLFQAWLRGPLSQGH